MINRSYEFLFILSLPHVPQGTCFTNFHYYYMCCKQGFLPAIVLKCHVYIHFYSLLTQRLQNLIPLSVDLCIICLLLENCWVVPKFFDGIFSAVCVFGSCFPTLAGNFASHLFSPFIRNKTGLLFLTDWAEQLSCIFWAFWCNSVTAAVWSVVDAGIRSYKHTRGSLYNQLKKSKSTPLWIGWMWNCLAQSEFAQLHN